jgi:hypothetical protein
MNEIKFENRISNIESTESETTLARFDAFKSSLKPNPEALRRALAQIHIDAPTAPRRTVRVRAFVAAFGTMALAFALLLSPRTAAPSSLSQSLIAEEQAVDAPDADTDVDTTIAVDQADLMLTRLASDTTL